ncbi:MAG: HDOD domain-containing protein [Phycisphaerae bacterium]
MASEVYEKIKAADRLPTPSGTVLTLVDLANREDSTLNQMATVVESDPGLASRLVKLVNSPLAALSRQIASVQQAIALLGLATVKSVALGFSLVDNNRKGACAAFDYETFWSESVARATTARHVGNRLKNFPPDEAFTCGLLCQIGRLALATAFPKDYAAILAEVKANDRALTDVETEAFNIDHNELAAEMMADWLMPAMFCDAVRNQDKPQSSAPESRPEQLAQILRLGGLVATLLVKTPMTYDFSTLTQTANTLGIKPTVLPEVFDCIREEWQGLGSILDVKTQRSASLIELRTQAGNRHFR